MSSLLEIQDKVYAELLTGALPRPIRNDEDHARTVATLLELDERPQPTPEEEALAELLTLLIEDYETNRYPLPAIAPNESLKALMAERGYSYQQILQHYYRGAALTQLYRVN